MDTQILTTDFGRVTKIFVTRCAAGQYYYMQQNGDEVEWIRQVHKSEVKPFFICPSEIAKAIAIVIDKEFQCKCL